MPFIDCIIYFAVTGIIFFFFGRLLPPRWFHWERFPYKTLPFEKGGALYKRLRIQCWQNKVPDMSRILPKLMPPKRMVNKDDGGLLRMIQETCIAELTHGVLCVTGLHCMNIWPGLGGTALATLNVFFFNLPFILIQRYNRPRLVRLYYRRQKKEENEKICLP